MNTLRRKRLLDKLVEAYVDWRETCARVNAAYRSWASEPAPGDSVAFAIYMAALDMEQQAAEVYAGLVRRAETLASSEGPGPEPLRRPAWGVGWL